MLSFHCAIFIVEALLVMKISAFLSVIFRAFYATLFIVFMWDWWNFVIIFTLRSQLTLMSTSVFDKVTNYPKYSGRIAPFLAEYFAEIQDIYFQIFAAIFGDGFLVIEKCRSVIAMSWQKGLYVPSFSSTFIFFNCPVFTLTMLHLPDIFKFTVFRL